MAGVVVNGVDMELEITPRYGDKLAVDIQFSEGSIQQFYRKARSDALLFRWQRRRKLSIKSL